MAFDFSAYRPISGLGEPRWAPGEVCRGGCMRSCETHLRNRRDR